jgi:hypothetical protein
MRTVKMGEPQIKKHSVRYDALDDNEMLSAVYVLKTALPKEIPSEITVSIEEATEKEV